MTPPAFSDAARISSPSRLPWTHTAAARTKTASWNRGDRPRRDIVEQRRRRFLREFDWLGVLLRTLGDVLLYLRRFRQLRSGPVGLLRRV